MPDQNEESLKALPFLMKHVPEFYRRKAERELNETPEKRISALRELKELARGHKDTCHIEFVDDFLYQFLRIRKYDVSKAFKQLLNYLKFAHNYSSLFESLDLDLLFRYPATQYFTILPGRCPEGCTMVLFELGKWDPDKVPFEDFKKSAVMVINQTLRDPMTQINGYKILLDFTGTTLLRHIRYCTPKNLYLLYHGGINCFPGRYKAVYLVNYTFIAKACWTIVRAFASEKLRKRVFLLSTNQVLQYFSPSLLPSQYGGDLKDYIMKDWTKAANVQQAEFTDQGQHNYY